MDKPKKRHNCFVPLCTNTGCKTPKKRFLTVPRNPHTREQWCRAVQRREVPRGTAYCCQDHFNLEEDLENYKDFMIRRKRARFKAGVVPQRCNPKIILESATVRHVKKKNKKHFQTLQEQMAVLERVDAGLSGTEICAEFGIKFKTFFYIMKNQKKIRADAKATQNSVNASQVNRTNNTQRNYAFLDAEVFRWYQQECAAAVHVSGDDLKRFAAQLAKYSNITDFKASDHWLSKFQKQYSIDGLRAAGPSASADKPAMDPFSEEMHGVIFPSNQHDPATDTSAEASTVIAPTETVYIVERDTNRATLEYECIDLESEPDVNIFKDIPDSTPLVYTSPSQNVHNTEINGLQPRETNSCELPPPELNIEINDLQPRESSTCDLPPPELKEINGLQPRETNSCDLPPPEQDTDLHSELRKELREIREFMGQMSSSMRSVQGAIKGISETLKVIAASHSGIR